MLQPSIIPLLSMGGVLVSGLFAPPYLQWMADPFYFLTVYF